MSNCYHGLYYVVISNLDFVIDITVTHGYLLTVNQIRNKLIRSLVKCPDFNRCHAYSHGTFVN